jgi:hypothetical protein
MAIGPEFIVLSSRLPHSHCQPALVSTRARCRDPCGDEALLARQVVRERRKNLIHQRQIAALRAPRTARCRWAPTLRNFLFSRLSHWWFSEQAAAKSNSVM